jgi:predicted ABC-type ATPase
LKPLLVLLAGPNGSGKSTLCATPSFAAMLADNKAAIINPDEIAKHAPADSNALIWSGRKVHNLIAEMTMEGKSFLVETTLSGRNHFRTLDRARAAGYYIALHFVFVSTIERSKQRVRLRVQTGGHDVPEVDQERRFNKSLHHMAEFLPLTDEAFVYSNDFETGHERVAEYLQGKCQWCKRDAPNWLPR